MYTIFNNFMMEMKYFLNLLYAYIFSEYAPARFLRACITNDSKYVIVKTNITNIIKTLHLLIGLSKMKLIK
jgi:hypothetical protein